MSNSAKTVYQRILSESGDDLYVKLLFYITHQLFDEKDSKLLWNEILDHKKAISALLGRNVEISVATLDYLTNIKSEIKNPKLIGEAFIGKIAEIASVDSLTKIYNRQYLFLKIKEELNRYIRYKTTFSMVMIDLDDFKHINDTFGHQKGDKILSKFGEILERTKRELDVCARYGGEEFFLILPHTEIEEAFAIAERLRGTVVEEFQSDGLTVSIGVSNCPIHGTSVKSLIKQADEALYKSKDEGKNRVS